MNAGWEPIDDHIALAWVKAEAKREWGGVTPLGEDPVELHRLWLRRAMGFVRALAAREFATRICLPREPAGQAPWCVLCGIEEAHAGPGCPWRDCLHRGKA